MSFQMVDVFFFNLSFKLLLFLEFLSLSLPFSENWISYFSVSIFWGNTEFSLSILDLFKDHALFAKVEICQTINIFWLYLTYDQLINYISLCRSKTLMARFVQIKDQTIESYLLIVSFYKYAWFETSLWQRSSDSSVQNMLGLRDRWADNDLLARAGISSCENLSSAHRSKSSCGDKWISWSSNCSDTSDLIWWDISYSCCACDYRISILARSRINCSFRCIYKYRPT